MSLFRLCSTCTDEVLMDFLSVWNPAVMKLKDTIPFLPLPTFSFEVWITGLILANIILFSLSPLAFGGIRFYGPAILLCRRRSALKRITAHGQLILPFAGPYGILFFSFFNFLLNQPAP